ncbi:AraC family transcriptional regulator [Kiritimatiellaeota bacterium B1221]|nr:AraC family transcriptional regulator [Kiritimatiellaeota bacterium B1221]
MKAPQQRISEWGKLDIRLYYCYQGTVPHTGHGITENPTFSSWLVLRGWGEITDEHATTALRANVGEWMFVKPGKRHQQFSPRAKLLSVSFFAKHFTGQPLVNQEHSFKCEDRDFPHLKRAASRLRAKVPEAEYLNPVVDLMQHLNIQQSLLEWIREWCTVISKTTYKMETVLGYDSRVVAALQYLETHIGDKHLTSEQVGHEVGLSVGQLNRLFLKETGRTLNEFRVRQRIDHASRLLTQSDTSLKEIAYNLGFSYPSHFSAWFKQQRGKTPSQHRKDNVRFV